MKFDRSASINSLGDGPLHRHSGNIFINFDAKSVLSTLKDVHLIGESTIKNQQTKDYFKYVIAVLSRKYAKFVILLIKTAIT